MTLGKRILKSRTLRRQSREKLARSIDMSSRTIERWENDETEPSAGDLAILARVLKVGEEWLRTGEGEMFATYQAGHLAPAGESRNPTPTHHTQTTSQTGGDMTYDPSWVVPMVMSAHVAIMNSSDLEKARLLKESGRRFRVRLVIEEEEKPHEHNTRRP